jgi:branched-chain amino acid transport system substrate-binding protein
MRRSFLLFSALAAFAVGQAEAQDKIAKLGLLAPMTGARAADGDDIAKGAQLAVDEINAAGGINGYKFELVVGDIQDSAPDVVTNVFERLASDPDLNFMFSGWVSTTLFEFDLMADQEMPYILTGLAAETRKMLMENPDKYPTVWNFTVPPEVASGTPLPMVTQLVEEGKLKLGTTNLAMISSDNNFSKDLMANTSKSFEAAGWTVKSNEVVPFTEISDWRPYLQKMREAEASFIINTDFIITNGAKFLTQFLEQPINSLIFIQYAPSVPQFLDLTKEKANGVIYSVPGAIYGTEQKNPVARQAIEHFRAKYGADAGLYGLWAYQDVYIYAEALKKVGDHRRRLEIGQAIGQIDMQTVSGRLKFDAETHLALAGDDYLPVIFFQVWDGKPTAYWPAAWKSGEFRTPPWFK